MTATPSGRLKAVDKHVLLDGKHIADCRDKATAEAVRDALDFAGVGSSDTPAYALRSILTLLI